MSKAKDDTSMRECAQLSTAILLAATILVVATDRARPADGPTGSGFCEPKSAMMSQAKDHQATWHKATAAQWQFLRGISAMDPITPPGLPYGDSAGWLTRDGDETGLVWFIDSDQACSPMPIPKTLLDMLDDILVGKILHPGKAL